jgi:hypothetical protein
VGYNLAAGFGSMSAAAKEIPNAVERTERERKAF